MLTECLPVNACRRAAGWGLRSPPAHIIPPAAVSGGFAGDSGSGGSSSSGRNAGGQLAYVGHSQGTTQMFAALSSSPALRARLSLAIMLAPAVHMRHIQALPLQVLAAMDADKVGSQCCPAGWLGGLLAGWLARWLVAAGACFGTASAAQASPARSPQISLHLYHPPCLPARLPAALQPAGRLRVPALPPGGGRPLWPAVHPDAAGVRLDHHRNLRLQL